MNRSHKTRLLTALLIPLLACWLPARAQDSTSGADDVATETTEAGEPAPTPSFKGAASTVREQLEQAIVELNELRATMAEEKIPLSRELNQLEAELTQVRTDYQATTRQLDSRTLDLSNLQTEIKSRQDETTYLSNLLSEYIRKFESGLHIAELDRYEEQLESAKLALENNNLTEQQVFAAQADVLSLSLDRLVDALGGTRFEGTAVDPNGLVDQGTFVLVGPAAIFRSADGVDVGTAEQRLGSLEPSGVAFANPLDVAAAATVITDGEGLFPLDPSLGNAHKIEATKETLWEHVQKGGEVMIPIFALAALALLVAIYKWIALSLLRKPSKQQIKLLLDAVGNDDEAAAREQAGKLKGPVGQMLSVGTDHLHEPSELVEEAMYETVLTTRLKVERLLPFIAISASSAPLLGLLGTVTGIINTFKLITVFGSGDVKSLSGGISEALITTKFGLIVAIPSLLLHAFLSRKARGIISQMETSAVAFVNQLARSTFGRAAQTGGTVNAVLDPQVVRDQVAKAVDERLAAAPVADPELLNQVAMLLDEVSDPERVEARVNAIVDERLESAPDSDPELVGAQVQALIEEQLAAAPALDPALMQARIDQLVAERLADELATERQPRVVIKPDAQIVKQHVRAQVKRLLDEVLPTMVKHSVDDALQQTQQPGSSESVGGYSRLDAEPGSHDQPSSPTVVHDNAPPTLANNNSHSAPDMASVLRERLKRLTSRD